MHVKEDIEKLAKEFENCQKVLIALGDEIWFKADIHFPVNGNDC